MSLSVLVGLGYLLDGIIGDPRWLPHPVRAIGWLISTGERFLNRGSAATGLATGVLLATVVVGISVGVAWALVLVATLIHPWLGSAVTVLGIGVLLARRSLAQEAGHAVYRPLAAGDLPEARKAVGWVVGRDTAGLTESEVARASLETLAENASDGIIAPLLFALVGGLPAIAAYKAINTLDSMIGHRDQRYLYFGRSAARLDDLANLIPARLTMIALVVACAMLGRDAKGAWQSATADALTHKSPNAGWPEAALAGGLGVRLGGINYYDGEPSHGPTLNSSGRPPAPGDIPVALTLIDLASHLILGLGLVIHKLL